MLREALNETTKRRLAKEPWSDCVNAIGGAMLSCVLGQTRYARSVAAVGRAGGLEALQTASVAAAMPVSIIVLFMTWGIAKSLKEYSTAVALPAETLAPDGTSLRYDLGG